MTICLMDLDGTTIWPQGWRRPEGEGSTFSADPPHRGLLGSSPTGDLTFWVPDGMRHLLKDLQLVMDMAWCSAWGEQARTVVAPELMVGADWATCDLSACVGRLYAGEVAPDETWKLKCVQAWAEKQGREVAIGETEAEASAEEHRVDPPIVWVDDALGRDAQEWAIRRTEEVAPTLLVPVARAGLTREGVDGILAWEEGLA